MSYFDKTLQGRSATEYLQTHAKDFCLLSNYIYGRFQEHPASCSAEKLFYSGYFAGKIDPVLCAAGKMKYVCWETFSQLFVKWALSP